MVFGIENIGKHYASQNILAVWALNSLKLLAGKILGSYAWMQFKPRPRYENEEQTKVATQIINQEQGRWYEDFLQQLFDEESVKAILKIHIPPIPKADQICLVKGEV